MAIWLYSNALSLSFFIMVIYCSDNFLSGKQLWLLVILVNFARFPCLMNILFRVELFDVDPSHGLTLLCRE